MDWFPFRRPGAAGGVVTVPDPKMVSFYSQFIRPGDLVFDVGANVGNRTAIFLELGARVVAVEPQKACAKILERCFGRNKAFVLEKLALGATAGTDYLYQGSVNTLSSMSENWIDTVCHSGRFKAYSWDRRRRVKVTTLDNLIHCYGMPYFVKIDVEGYELEVIRGLSRPPNMLSMEFAPEILNPTFEAIRLLSDKGSASFNYGLGEATSLELETWVGQEQIMERLSSYRDRIDVFGDVYVRFDHAKERGNSS